MAETVESFSAGAGSTVAGVGMLIALGAMFGKLPADSGGADQIVDTIIGRSSDRMLPWAMAAIGAIIGLLMFFEIGLVLLMPVIFLVARRWGKLLVALGIPALAGLSAMHGFVPPHPGPLAAVGQLEADPLFARLATAWVDVPPPDLFAADETQRSGDRHRSR
jgi:GntP family gluconate:H+ symporter